MTDTVCEITDLARVSLAEGDALLIRIPPRMSAEVARKMAEELEQQFPANKIIVTTDDIEFSVVAQAA